jgi:hypothetical protein
MQGDSRSVSSCVSFSLCFALLIGVGSLEQKSAHALRVRQDFLLKFHFFALAVNFDVKQIKGRYFDLSIIIRNFNPVMSRGECN